MMLKQIKALSRAKCEEAVQNRQFDVPYAIISINEPAATGAGVYTACVTDKKDPNQIGVLRLWFEDSPSQEFPSAMTLTQALDIVQFVEQIKDKAELLIIHCLAGTSRSAGVAAALLHIYFQNESEIFENARFAPNMYCLRLVIKAADTDYDSAYWEAKERNLYNLSKQKAAKNYKVADSCLY